MNETAGRGADLVVEVGGAGTFSRSLKALRVGGAMAQIGVLSESSEGIQVPLLLHRQIRLCGIYVGSRKDFEKMNQAIRQQKLEPVVDEVFSFHAVGEALRRMESGQHFGKLVTSVTH